MGKGSFRPHTESTPLNRSSTNLSQVITLATPTAVPNLVHGGLLCEWVTYNQHFWAAVCKNGSPYAIRPVSVCPVLSVLPVTLVYCGQTVGWINMKLGTQVGLVPGHIVLDGDTAPLPKTGRSPPILGPYLLWPNGSMDQDIKMPHGMEVGLSPSDTVLRCIPRCNTQKARLC